MNSRIFAAALVLAISWSVVGAFAQEQAAAPAFKEGDTWQINISRKDQGASSSSQTEGAYELVFTQGKIKVFEINGDQKSEVNIQPDSPAEGLLGVVGKNEKRPDLKFPLSVGQKWEYQVVVRPAGSRQDQRRSAEVTVVGQEQVTHQPVPSKHLNWSGAKAGRSVEEAARIVAPRHSTTVRKLEVSLSELPKTRTVLL